ncbi:head decoration protein [Rhodoferax sp.]|uniref:head decoration protein n=1 Tax=Rhodoferax sp. TaxID=50421 RepID=UPI0019D9F39A|nr:head decoration protein [Rhodoferax sp.]MBE0475324.1 head decoration protein [Rhodoferax sp.]
MTAINETQNLGDLLKYEEDHLRYSREVATVAAGQKLTLGTVVARETASAKLMQLDPLATDGSENPIGVLLNDVDASLIDVQDALLLNRHAVLASECVIWPAGITAAAKTAAIGALADLGILIRQSA